MSAFCRLGDIAQRRHQLSAKCQKRTFQFHAPCEPTERVYQRGVSARDQLYHEATWKRCAPNGTDTSKREPIDITLIVNLRCVHCKSSGRWSEERSPWAHAWFLLLKMILSREPKRRSSMSLKFAALGSLTVLGALGTSARR